jgi:hypothetical protein
VSPLGKQQEQNQLTKTTRTTTRTMTKQKRGAPAQDARAKRIRLDESSNKTVDIDNSKPVAPQTPTEAALAHAKAAVALRPDAIKEVVLEALKSHLKLKTRIRELQQTQIRMNNDAFIPRSARFKFELTASDEIMETEEFKALAKTTKDDVAAFQQKCKQQILSVMELTMKDTQAQLKKQFFSGLKHLAIMLLHEQDNFSTTDPCPYAKFICWACNKNHITPEVFKANGTSPKDCFQEFENAIPHHDVSTPIQLTTSEDTLFLNTKDEMVKITKAVFLDSWSIIEIKHQEIETENRLKKAAITLLDEKATVATVMEVDKEPSTDPKTIRALIDEEVKKATAGLRQEVNRLHNHNQRLSTKPKQQPKNLSRGATPSPKSAPSTNKKRKGNKDGRDRANSPRKSTNMPPKKSHGTSPGTKDAASPAASKKEKQRPGGKQQQQKKGVRSSKKANSSK